MELQYQPKNPSVIYPENYIDEFQKKHETFSEFNHSGLDQEITTTKFDPTNEIAQTSNTDKKAFCIKIKCIALSILLLLFLLSIGFNIYLGIKVTQGEKHNEDIGKMRKTSVNWIYNCTDDIYQVQIPILTKKKLLLNVTHWSECYYQKQFPKSKSKNNQSVSQLTNLASPLVGDQQSEESEQQFNKSTEQFQGDNLIWIPELKVSIVAKVHQHQ